MRADKFERSYTGQGFTMIGEAKMATSSMFQQDCPLCPGPLQDPVFFEGELVCSEHVRACGECLAGRRLVEEPSCGPCSELIRPDVQAVA